jgi:peptidoglycan/xylan/chitin deacetylase (PgdA/CDA1 family)
MDKKPVLITIDTEGPCGSDPVEHLIYGVTNKGERCGIEMLMDIFDLYSVKGLFFVDIAEAWNYGKEKIKDVLKCIRQRGHDTGVHIHPDHIADKNRRYLWQYSYNEQYEILQQCLDFYCSCTGEMPLSFRAGRYGLNNDTLDILSKQGYQYDMSGFYGSRYCRISPPLTCNKLTIYKDIVEIPVTVYKSYECLGYSRYDKIDVSMPFGEFKRITGRMLSDDSIDIISLFLHSFSLLDWRKKCDAPKYLKREQSKACKMIEFLMDSGCSFISEKDLKYFKVSDRTEII